MFTNGVAYKGLGDLDWTALASKVTDAYSKRAAQKAVNEAMDLRQQHTLLAQKAATPAPVQYEQSKTILGMSPTMFTVASIFAVAGIGTLGYALSKK